MTTPPFDLDSPADSPHDDTKTHLLRFRTTLSEVRAMHAEAAVARVQDRERRSRLMRLCGWAAGVLLVPTLGTLGAGAWGIVRTSYAVGQISEQQTAMRADVSEVLDVTAQLRRDGVGVNSRLDESARDRAALHDAQRELERKLYDARRTSRPAGGTE